MKIVEVRYAKRVSDGNYGFEEVGLGAALEDGDKMEDALKDLRLKVNAELGLKPTPEPAAPVEEAPKRKEEKVEAGSEPNKKAAKNTGAKKKAAKKDKRVKYDREVSVHKNALGKILDEVYPEWRENKDKAQQLSKDLVGEFIFEENGEVCTSFVQLVQDALGK